MAETTNTVERLDPHLKNHTTATLYGACVTAPQFCRKQFTLETLIGVIGRDWRNLDTAGTLELLRDEVVFRLLITADRASARDMLLELLRNDPFADPAVHRFVTESYKPRSLTAFAMEEGKYLHAMRAAYREMSPLRTPLAAALAWFGVMPGQTPPHAFRVLFSNRPLRTRYGDVILPGLCLPFSFKGINGVQPFDGDDQQRLGDDFVRSARDAEVEAHRIRGQSFGSRKHRQVAIEVSYEDASFLEGSSGYLAFLMAHFCMLEGIALSPYVGFTGARKEMGQLDRVVDLPQKLAAAVHAGMHLVFVPARDYSMLSVPQQQGLGLIRVLPFDDQGHIDLIARKLLDQLRARQAELSGTIPSPRPQPAARRNRRRRLSQVGTSRGTHPIPPRDRRSLRYRRPGP